MASRGSLHLCVSDETGVTGSLSLLPLPCLPVSPTDLGLPSVPPSSQLRSLLSGSPLSPGGLGEPGGCCPGAGAAARIKQDVRLPVLWAPLLHACCPSGSARGRKSGRTQVEMEHGGKEEEEEGCGGTPASNSPISICHWGTHRAKPVQRRAHIASKSQAWRLAPRYRMGAEVRGDFVSV